MLAQRTVGGEGLAGGDWGGCHNQRHNYVAHELFHIRLLGVLDKGARSDSVWGGNGSGRGVNSDCVRACSELKGHRERECARGRHAKEVGGV